MDQRPGSGRRDGKTPPPLFAVGGRSDPARTEQLLAIPAGLPAAALEHIDGAEDVTEFEPEVLEGVLVDKPGAAGGGWMADRAGRLDQAPSVLPAWMRSRAELASNAGFVARWYGHMWGYYGLRAPVYVTRLWLRAPVGAKRLGGRWYRWVVDAQAQPVTAKAAAGTPAEWIQLANTQTNRTNGRRKASLIIGFPAAYGLYVGIRFAPPEAWAATVAAGASLLGAFGRHADRPIVHRYVAVRMQRRLESPEVEKALEAIGVKGTVDWVNPIAVDGPGWLAELDLPGAALADEVLEHRPQLAAAMRRPLGCVWPENDKQAHPGRLRLWVAREDPAKAKRRIWPLMKEGQADLWKPSPFGFDPRGRLVEVELVGTNWLIGGVMGSGKTSAVLVLALLAALMPAAELHIYELKGSGDLQSVEDVARVYVSGDDDEDCEAALNGLRWLKKELRRRKAIIKDLPLADVPNGRKLSAELAARLGMPLIVAIFDEVHTLFEHDEYGPPAAKDGADLIRKARAYGIILILTTQRPDKNSVPKPISDNAILRFCLAVTGHLANNLILGTGAYARGIRATMFDPQHDAGTGWLARSALNAQIVRAAFITQAEAHAIGQRAKALRIAAGTMPKEHGLEVVDASDLLDHLRAVWPAGEDTMHSATLVEALAAYRPEEYGAWMDADLTGRSTMLAAALKPYGVATRQVQKRGAGGSAKGIRSEDLEATIARRDGAAERDPEPELEDA
jgi:S-DNA-T family DNA segregation ATPase FtsK/SpoIIIE